MKTFKCYDCESSFQAETREQILDVLYAHYMKNHHGIISNASDEEKKQWMLQFEKDWAEAKEV